MSPASLNGTLWFTFRITWLLPEDFRPECRSRMYFVDEG
jgi:hypothetical protein